MKMTHYFFRFTLLLSLGILLYFFVTGINAIPNAFNANTNYYILNGQRETGANNLLTSIYLNYRFFDSVFEATILFVVTAGIFYMGKKDENVR